MNKSFCVMPWVNLTTNTTGEVMPCCVSSRIMKKEDGTPFNLGMDSIEEIYNSADYVKMREQMIAGEPVSGCEWCYNHESTGTKSNRNIFNEHWSVVDPEPIVDTKIKYFDIRFGNLCNLACRSCNSVNSSQFAKESNALQEQGMDRFSKLFLQDTNSWYNTETFLENFESHIDTLERLYLAGGEPSINKKVFDILNMLIDSGRSKDISLSISSNMTNTNTTFYTLLREFKDIVLFASIDGYGSTQEYLRYPSKWKAIDASLRAFMELDNAWVHIAPVIQIGNLNTIVDLFDYIETINREHGRSVIDILPIDLEKPDYLNLLYLPYDFKQDCWNRIEEWFNTKNEYISHLALDRLKSVKNKCMTKVSPDTIQQHLNDYVKYNEILDSNRNISLRDHNLELAEVINDPSLWR